MTKLTDIQAILLTLGAQREDGSLLPPPEGLQSKQDAVRKTIGQLIKRQLAVEVGVTDRIQVWREDGDLRYGAVVTDAGKQAIGVVEQPAPEASVLPDTAAAQARSPRADSKQGMVLEMLRRDGGASLDELVAATGWLPHTTRAALTGLRKKGHAITKEKVDGVTRYRIGANT